MPLTRFITEQKRSITRFLRDPKARLLRIGVDAEVEKLLTRLMSAIDDDPRSTEVFIGCDHAFESSASFWRTVLGRIGEEYQKAEPAMRERGISPPAFRGPLSSEDADESAIAAALTSFSRSLSTYADQLVLVLTAKNAADDADLCRSLGLVVEGIRHSPVKLIVLDDRQRPSLGPLLEDSIRVKSHDFHIGPETIEDGVKRALAEPDCPPLMRMRYLTVLAGFAMSRKDFGIALENGHKVLEHFQSQGNPQEEGAAAFNLANTYYRKQDYEPSRALYERALKHGLEARVHNLVEQCLINIGNTWFMCDNMEHAMAHYEGALRWSKAINNPFGECQSLELIGLVHQRLDHPEEAKQAWLDALRIYREMPAAMEQMAAAGQRQIIARLESAGESADAFVEAVHS